MDFNVALLMPDVSLLLLAALLLIAGARGFAARRIGLVAVYGLVAIAGGAIGSSLCGTQGVTAGGMIQVDGLAALLRIVLLLAAAGWTALCLDRMTEPGAERFVAWLLMGTLGACTLVSANDLVMAYLGLEVLGVAGYAMVGWHPAGRPSPVASGSALRQLILGFGASAVFLFGASLLFGVAGATQFGAIASGLADLGSSANAPLMLSGLLMVGGVLAKTCLVPFRQLDAREPMSLPMWGFQTTVALVGVAALVLKLVHATTAVAGPLWVPLAAIAGVAAMVYGNLRAMAETDLKRMLGYGALTQVGMLSLALIATSQAPTSLEATASIVFALAAWVLGQLVAFAVAGHDTESGDPSIAAVSGLYARAPGVALLFSMGLLTLAGMPLTFGFWGKLSVLRALVAYAITAQRFDFAWLALFGALNSVWAAYHYLRLVRMVLVEPAPTEAPLCASPGMLAIAAVGALGALALFLMPQPFWQAALQAAAGI